MENLTQSPASRFASVSALAATQHGAVSREQLRALGLAASWIDAQVRSGVLIPVSRGIYAVGHPRLSRRGQAWTALLRAGEGSAISHVSAARAWKIAPEATDGPIHVSLARRRGLQRLDGVVVHRPRSLTASDIVMHRGVPLTVPERTILDLLPSSKVVEVTRMLEQMIVQLRRSPDDLHVWGRTCAGAPGGATLERALDNIVGPAVLRSELERRFRSLCQDAGLPLPATNVRVAGWEVDVVWRDAWLAVELDSWRWHAGHWSFQRDRRMALALNREGFEVVRLTWSQIKHEPQEVVETLRAVLRRKQFGR